METIVVDCPNEIVAAEFKEKAARALVVTSVVYDAGKLTITAGTNIPELWFLLGQMLETSITKNHLINQAAQFQQKEAISFDDVIKNKIPFDASGIDNPNEWRWVKGNHTGVYHPVK